ncbi:hypothetical protein COLO4_09544 [Corchorus olitorius]|uniref:Terpene synthase metal-binding domain-containing protein n=1 Tax=Corchorus olitorius TaxID=93759 RepID=A0A1R3KBT8_9ROSI|nr:hypothetical protein COLO4_09544 [Corchorus olitorius]
MKQQIQAYHKEAKWLHENYKPTLEEYLSVALVSCAYHMLSVVSFVGMEDTITQETFIWSFKHPKILRASTIICRLMDDIFEQERGHVASAVECYTKHRGVSSEQEASAVECYMNQYGATEQDAYDDFNKKIKEAWKDINQEFLKPTAVPVSALTRVLNLVRVIDLLYKDEDAYTLVGAAAKTSITSLLIDPIQI